MHSEPHETTEPNSICNRLVKTICRSVMTNKVALENSVDDEGKVFFRPYSDAIADQLPDIFKGIKQSMVVAGSTETLGFIFEIQCAKFDNRTKDQDHEDIRS